MIPEQPLTKMVLDNMDIGRGRGIPKGMDGYHVITLDVKTWHVHENQSILLPDESFGQFHSGRILCYFGIFQSFGQLPKSSSLLATLNFLISRHLKRLLMC